MRDFLEEPVAVQQARERKKGMFWLLEILVFLAVFIVSGIVQSVFMLPMELIIKLQHPEMMEAAVSGDMEEYMRIFNEATSGNMYVIAMLFSTAGIIIITLLFCKLIQKRKMTSLGYVKKDMVKEYLIGMGGGFIFFSAAVLICVVTGTMKFNGFSENFSLGIFFLFLLGYMVQGMSEEVLCRGYFMVSMSRRYPVAAGILANSLVFASLHLANSGISILAFINLTLFGVFASLYFLKRGSIWGVAAFHSVWNLVQGNVYGVLVSGISSDCSIFSTTMVEGKELVNGGTFGLEGGIAVTIVFVVGIIFWCTRKSVDKGIEDDVIVKEI